uniref:Rho-GAP domain-containing protein n=2 Tax=Stomoxys calcitrans TaxID=35570 RepID=A0A1I8PFX7_STOCA
MDFTSFEKEDLRAQVVNELKYFGVKYRKERVTTAQESITQKKTSIFRSQLHTLQLSDAILANGSVVQIPKFVVDMCNFILDRVETEGIFRKAGSSIRQKEILAYLESGNPLDPSHHVIDVANVVKYFFRELPEPLIPSSLQETLLRALLIGKNNEKAVLLACMLLPTLTLNTLRFFMQFLRTVSLSEYLNKMSTSNLAIILTPSLMPFANIKSFRFTNHMKVVQMLIENANSIGIVPGNVASRVASKSFSSDIEAFSLSSPQCTDCSGINDEKKKKKRRSGSLTHMFNGFKRIVGANIGFPEESETNIIKGDLLSKERISEIDVHYTPCHKSKKKRKLAEPMSTCEKKKRELLALLPKKSGGFLPNTPLIKKSLKVCRNQQNVIVSSRTFAASTEKRWSTSGSGWQKHKNTENLKNTRSVFPDATRKYEVLDANIIRNHQQKADALKTEDSESQILNYLKEQTIQVIDQNVINNTQLDRGEKLVNTLEGVQMQYERILKETASLSLLKAKEMPLHVHCELKSRRRSHQPAVRSPSARKIGSIRRRSQDTFYFKHANNNKIVASDERARNLKCIRQSVDNGFELPHANTKHSKESSTEMKEHWMPGEYFFKKFLNEDPIDATPIKKHVGDAILPINNSSEIFPTRDSSENLRIKAASTSKVQFISRIADSRSINAEECGRASISRLRTDNAGMVMAKARLFDRLRDSNEQIHYRRNVFKNSKVSENICKNQTTCSSRDNLYSHKYNTEMDNKIHGQNKGLPIVNSRQHNRNFKYVKNKRDFEVFPKKTLPNPKKEGHNFF